MRFCIVSVAAVLLASPVFADEFVPGENTLWVRMPKRVSMYGNKYVWQPTFTVGGDYESGGCFVIDDTATKAMLMNIWLGTHGKKDTGYVMVNSIKEEIENGTALARELAKVERQERIERAEYQRWLFEKQLEIWKLRIEEDKALSARQQADALQRISRAISRQYGF
jgi:hypothetical protein